MKPTKEPWYIRYEKAAVWATLFAVVVGGIARYVLLEAPAARSQSARTTDELVETLRPNLQASYDHEPVWTKDGALMRIKVTNFGARALVIQKPFANISWYRLGDAKDFKLPSKEEVSVTTDCSGLLSPSESLICEVLVNLGPHGENVNKLVFKVNFQGETALRRDSQTWKVLRKDYSEEYIVEHVKKTLDRERSIFR